MSKATESKENEVKTDGRKGREWSPSFSRTVKFYDADFNLQEKKIEDKIVPAKTLQEAYNLGLSQEEMILALNNACKLKLIEEKTEATIGDGISESTLNKFIESYRAVSRFAKITDKKEQTAAIIAKVKSDPDLIEMLRADTKVETSGSDSE